MLDELCACGNPAEPNKLRGGDALTFEPTCARCRILDGASPRQYDLIAALRDCGRLSIRELANVLAMDPAQVQRALKAMVYSGRVERIEDPVYEPAVDTVPPVCFRLTPDGGF